MKKFLASSVELALLDASREFSCPVNEIEYEVILQAKKGFLGFGRQDAVILANRKVNPVREEVSTKTLTREETFFDEEQFSYVDSKDDYSQIQNNFFQDKSKFLDLDSKIEKEVLELFALLPYKIDQIKVKIQNDCAYIEINGADCGLLIGEKGYRYHAICYLLSIWIKKEYDLSLRLEIADFLKNKEKRVEEYLEEHYDAMTSRSFFQTQAFDILSANIALKRFREAIPDKYIITKQISESESLILVSDFRNR